MKKNEKAREEYRKIRRTLLAALCMLLVSSVMMATTSYAWFVMAVSPEVTGITTNVAANGSLEIALLTTETRQDLTLIRSGVGQSLAANVLGANNTWGNLVDLNDESYGLSDIVLMPARLDIKGDAESGYTVGQNGLLAPVYGYDGRVVSVDKNTVSGLYNNGVFTTQLGAQGFGVRAFGTSSQISTQAAALALAKSNVRTYTNEARSYATTALSSNGANLFNIVIAYSTNANATFDDADLKVIKNMVAGLETSLGKIDDAMRQAVLALAASQVADEAEFEVINNLILGGTALSELMDDVTGLPEEFAQWIAALESAQNDLNQASNACAALNDGEYTWDELKNAMTPIMDMDKILIGDYLFPEATRDYLMDLVGQTIEMTLAPGSGVFADIADFAGNYEANISAVGSDVIIQTMSVENPARLNALSAVIADLEAAGDVGASAAVELDTTYGYALDFAFRTNAVGSNLLLQTEASQRVYGDSTSVATMGGGSYMEFSTEVADFSIDQMIQLMDAIRVAFVDADNNIIGIAKLNTSNRTTSDGIVKAPLYLYDFEISTDPESAGALVMGERQKVDNTLTNLTKGVAKALSVMVWLDGDMVDNSMVPASEGLAMGGMLNLQFASSADLIPADNEELKNLATDKAGLSAALDVLKSTYEAGRDNYSTTSWNEFVAAYEYAQAIVEDPTADDMDAAKAAKDLALAQLVPLDLEALQSAVEHYRELMGTETLEGGGNEIAYYVVKAENGELSLVSGTAPEGSVGTIYAVENLYKVEEKEVYSTDISRNNYTKESWDNLADALYRAELVLNYYENPTDEEIDEAILALTEAEEALEHILYFEPYIYEGEIYYFAISDAENADTYGKWYDANFKRVVSDLTILKLDANAEEFKIATINAPKYIKQGSQDSFVATIELLSNLYPTLKNDAIKDIKWSVDDSYFTMGDALLGSATYIKGAGDTGKGAITATVLTEKGVYFDVVMEISVYAPIERVTITYSHAMTVGEAQDLELSVEQADAAVGETVQSITWSSSNMKVLKVDSNGNVTAVGAGQADITYVVTTAEGNSYTGIVAITVSEPAEPTP